MWKAPMHALSNISADAPRAMLDMQERLLEQAHKTVEAHVGQRMVPIKAIRQQCEALRPTLYQILAMRDHLSTAALKEAPLRPDATADPKQR